MSTYMAKKGEVERKILCLHRKYSFQQCPPKTFLTFHNIRFCILIYFYK